ncbi:tetratricopeptide repeat protein [Helicobacter labacensis]|uniref:tetratricopeptide repeat protein n=1 Tax=Helicobacter labacensis TaxID=2316079 RepID=UPI001F3B0655|nr:tetratricopeptide repeat protein [Helicobacter labacensis]
MEIDHVEQEGTKVCAYDSDNKVLFKKPGELVFYMSDYVLIRRGNKICKLDSYGYVLDSNFDLKKIGRVDCNNGSVDVYDEEGNKLFSEPGELVDFTEYLVRVKQGKETYTFSSYGEIIEVEKPMGCLGWLMLILVGLAIIIGIAYCSVKQHANEQNTRYVFTKDYNQRAQAFHDAMELFTDQEYKQAQERFIWLAQIKYRPAFSSYMAGQCAYKEKRYQEAIKFYKQSLAIKEQASYTSILLENMANAYKALKDEKHYTHYKHLLEQQKTQN